MTETGFWTVGEIECRLFRRHPVILFVNFTSTGIPRLAITGALRMKNMVRRLLSIAGLEVSRIDRVRWSQMAEHYYPVNFQPRYGHGRPSHPQIKALLEAEIDNYRTLLNDFQRYRKYFSSVSMDATSVSAPFWNNDWFSSLDAAALMYFIISRQPKEYIEVGSGFSTKFARLAISSGSSQTTLTSIDPHPRSEIDEICTEIIRSPLEDLDVSLFDRLKKGDIAFFDGSHRIFTNSDTTAFFMDVLPRLKSGVLVHIHDIFWPDDYTPQWNKRLYSEQYVLGGMMLGGLSKLKVVLPNYFVSMDQRTAPLIANLGIPTRYAGTTNPGLSFWLEVQ